MEIFINMTLSFIYKTRNHDKLHLTLKPALLHEINKNANFLVLWTSLRSSSPFTTSRTFITTFPFMHNSYLSPFASSCACHFLEFSLHVFHFLFLLFSSLSFPFLACFMSRLSARLHVCKHAWGPTDSCESTVLLRRPIVALKVV